MKNLDFSGIMAYITYIFIYNTYNVRIAERRNIKCTQWVVYTRRKVSMNNDQRLEVRLPTNLIEKIDQARASLKPFAPLTRSDLVRKFIVQGLDNSQKAGPTTESLNWPSLASNLQLFLQLSAVRQHPSISRNFNGEYAKRPDIDLVFLAKRMFDNGYLWFFHLNAENVANKFGFFQTDQLNFIFDKPDEGIINKFEFVCDLYSAFNIIDEMLLTVDIDIAKRIRNLAEQNHIALDFTGCSDLQLAQMASLLRGGYPLVASKPSVNFPRASYDKDARSIDTYKDFLAAFEDELSEMRCSAYNIEINKETSFKFLSDLVM